MQKSSLTREKGELRGKSFAAAANNDDTMPLVVEYVKDHLFINAVVLLPSTFYFHVSTSGEQHYLDWTA